MLTRANDPFYCGTPGQVENAEWFAALWEEHGALGHLRRLHYRLISGKERVAFAEGRAYRNDLLSFNRLCNIGADARSLGLVDAGKFEDRRNPPPIENARPREFEPEPGAEIGEPEVDWQTALPQVPGAHFLNVEEFEIPEPQIIGVRLRPRRPARAG